LGHRIKLLGACVALLFGAGARAGGSLLVDDATVTPAGRCQIETWVRAFSPGQELSVAPACNRIDTEFSLGITQFFRPEYGPILSLGAKHLWRDFEGDRFGIGTSAGIAYSTETDRIAAWTVDVPASVSLDEDHRLMVHVNIGWLELRGAPGRATGGVGIQHALTERFLLMAEIYAQDDGLRIGQLGFNYALSDSMDFDVLIGYDDAIDNAPWVTLGLNVLMQ
jgi:hypothetical protein